MMTKSINWSLVGAIVLSAGFGCSVAAAAQPAGPDETGATSETAHMGRPDPARFIQRFDQNKNGTLEIAELPERMQKGLAAADTNKDGVLSIDELKAHGEARRAEMFKRADKDNNGALTADEVGRRWERLQVADADHNGSVTRAELDQARADGKLAPPHRGPHGGGADGGASGEHCAKGGGHMFQKIDKNNDGAITSDEVKNEFWEHLVKADANHDGRVTKEEHEHARAARGKR
jgi:hypothetical protein